MEPVATSRLIPCLPCCLIPKMMKMQAQYKEKVDSITAKNKQTLESGGFTCVLIVILVDQSQGRHHKSRTSYQIEFQKYTNVAVVQNFGPMGPGKYPEGNYQQGYQPYT